MNKQEFMNELKKELVPLKQSARLEIIADIQEHFDSGQSSGKTEQQVANELGSPRELAQEYISTAGENEKNVISHVPPNTMRSIGRILAILFFDLIVIIPLAAILFSLVVSLWAIPTGIFAAAVGVAIFPLINMAFSIPYYVALIVSVSLLALSVGLGIGMYYISKAFVKFVADIAKEHYKIIVGGK